MDNSLSMQKSTKKEKCAHTYSFQKKIPNSLMVVNWIHWIPLFPQNESLYKVCMNFFYKVYYKRKCTDEFGYCKSFNLKKEDAIWLNWS